MPSHRKHILFALIGTILVLVLYGIGGNVQRIGVPLLCSVLVLYLVIVLQRLRHKRHTTTRLPARPASNSLPRQIEKEVTESSQVPISVLGAQYRRSHWKRTREIVDTTLGRCIELIETNISAHTIAIFFPTADGGYSIRRFTSKSPHINTRAVLYPGKGVIGGFLKDGLRRLNLQDIVTDSMTLYYYTKDAGIRSLMASPIIAGGVERGTIILDSTEKNHFTDEDHTFVGAVADILAQAVYYTYLYNDHKLEHQRLAAMSSIEKYFFHNLDTDAILDKLVEIIPFAVACNRLTISIREDDEHRAVIRRVWGENTDGLVDAVFSLEEKSLVALLYAKNMHFFRNVSPDHYEIRYFEGEPRSEQFASFLIVPVGVGTCRGSILLESSKEDGFTEANRDLLLRLSTSAGLALEKVHILEQARTLATHDGLTGLINHRQLLTLLRDHITQAIRYSEPLTFVLCDIDHFKNVNDTYGHPFGDTVLKEVAAMFKKSIREGIDRAARYGGEEFSFILAKTDRDQAVETIERIRRNIADILFNAPGGKQVHVTMSFGIALYRDHAKNLDDLIRKADKALYRAKENGRNRVEIFS